MTAPTILDTRTGQMLSPYIGADPIEPLTPPAATPDASKTPENKNDASAAAPAAGDGAPDAGNTPPADVAAASAAATGEPSDSVAQGEGEPEGSTATRDDKGRFIPKARFDEVNERRKAAEKKIAERDAADAAAAKAKENQFDFDKAERDYMSLLLDGKLDEATAKRKEIRAAEQEQFTAVAQTQATTVNKQVSERDRKLQIATEFEADYPAFDPSHADFKEEIAHDVNALYSGYLDSGRYEDSPAAFKAAIEKVVQMHGLKKAASTSAAPAASAPVAPLRTAQKRVEAIVNQPPMIAKAGAASASAGDGVVKASELTEAQTMALPEATRRRLRGDNL